MDCRLRYKAKVAAFLRVPIDLKSFLPKPWQKYVDLSLLDQISSHLTGNFLPHESKIFRSLEIHPDLVKIIILGQDPYPNAKHATGLAFSVPSTVSPLPASLRNIFIELESDLGLVRKNGDLSDWCSQGVLLLNTSLTINLENKSAHTKIGWQKFAESLIANLSKRKVVGILWGKPAQEMRHYFAEEDLFTSAHPSPLSAYRGFFGSKPFSRSNSRLVEKGLTPVEW